MATKEAKSESKKAEHEKAPEAIPLELENLPSLPYKICSLSVSIHCEGCKRKVKKILTNIEGVYKVDVDPKQHNVTVVGIVSPEILIKKLNKAGKKAEILPEKPFPKENKPSNNPNPKKKDKKKGDSNTPRRNDDGPTASCDRDNAGEKSVNPKIDGACGDEKAVSCDPSNACSSAGEKPLHSDNAADGDGEKGVSGGGDNAGNGKTSAGGETGEAGGAVKEKQADTKEAAAVVADNQSQAVEGENVEASGSGSIGKKKKKKGRKGNNNENAVNASTSTPADLGSTPSLTPLVVPHAAANHSHPSHRQQFSANHSLPPYQEYPPNFYMPPPINGVNYNMAQAPASVYGASYHTTPYSYAYMQPGFPPSDQNPYPSSRRSDSFEFFSDENPNACSVM